MVRIFKPAPTAWDGTWSMILYNLPEEDRDERERLRRRLSWHGFGPLAPSTWISPHPRLDDVAAEFPKIPTSNLHLLECRSRGRAADLNLVERCWDLTGLRSDYESLLDRYRHFPSAVELGRVTGAEALRRQISLIAECRSYPFRDPDLPSELLPEKWPGRDAHEEFVNLHRLLQTRAHEYVRAVVARHEETQPKRSGQAATSRSAGDTTAPRVHAEP